MDRNCKEIEREQRWGYQESNKKGFTLSLE